MQDAMMHGQSPSSTLNNGNSSTPDPPVSSCSSASSSDSDRLRASMEAWKRTAAIASERYSEARQRQIAVEREDRHELRKRWLEDEAKKRAESVGKQKDDRKRHLDTNDYGHDEWRQGFRMMEGSSMTEVSKASADMYGNMTYPVPNGNFYPGMMMSDMQMRNKGMMPGFPTPGFPSNASYPAGSYAANGGTPQAQNGPFPMSKSTPNFCANSFPTTQTSSAMGCSPMPSTSTADASTGASLGPRFPSMELPQFPISTDSTPAIPQQQSQQGQFSTSDSTPYGCGMRPSPSMCPTSPNEVPTPPALANSGSVPVGSSCTSSSMIEQNLRSPAEDLGCNAVNEDNMTRMLTSIRTDSLGMLGADAVDSLFDNEAGDECAAGQVPLVTSTDANSSPTGFSHGGPQSVHSVHSAPQSNSNCNPPSTPTASVTPSAPCSTAYQPQGSTSQTNGFPQSSPQSSTTFRPSPPPQQSSGFAQSAPGQPPPYAQSAQAQNAFFQQQQQSLSSQSAASYPTTSMPAASSSQTACFGGSSAQQATSCPQQNVMQQSAYGQQMPSGSGYPPNMAAQPSTSNPYQCASSGMIPNSADPAFMAQQGMMNPGYDMSSAQMSQQQQMAMQAHHQQQMAMGMAGPGAAMSAQQYHMAMMQKHQQHMKVMMQQRAAMMYQGYPNGASMSQQQYFMQMQKMQQTR
ncbi:unnamed protein product [Heligmosomoides polygyrus]|uniref:MamL-1 domain-containing protein n=1 Tax=Heligmosomoides polygyrus TaxID=6339 RepID=A0A3P7XL76_HELPZ|nr:unnamed protein product [Heligmosomoides polygyrus]